VIIIQAGAAEDVFGTSPQAARQALGSIGSAGRQALAELRRVLAAVRPQPGEPDGWAPPPGLSGLGELLDRVRAAGLTVTARVDGAPADLPAGLDLAAYRIVQEALTNTLKHGRAQAAEVTVRYRPAGLVLEVLDDGQPIASAGQPGPGPGRGLIGIRERAALHGGTCAAGPRPGGGFGVRVRLPLDAVGRAGTLASGTALMPPRETVAIKETAMSRSARGDPRSGPRRRRRLLIAGDAALALVLAAGAVALVTAAPSEAEPYWAAGIAVALLQTLPLAFRRWRPLWVLAVVVAATLGAEIAREGNGLFGLATAVALYSVAAYCPRRQAAWAGIATGAVLAWPLVRDGGGPGGLQSLEQIGQDAAISLGFPALAWLSGAYVSELRARAARSRREQELETGRAIAEEQARVGRELHDVIAHTLSVIIIQAGAADDVFDTSPQAARQALRSIGAAGRQALAELRRVLQTVRPQPGEDAGGAPPPGLSGLGELLDRVRAAGLTVTARVDGAPADLPAGLDLAAYRIVQEALTNTLKHGRAQAAEVTVRYRPAGLVLEVLDDGQPIASAGQPGPGPGRGLIGIRERAALHGGTCAAGPRPGGGFGVRVRLPLPGDRPS
jgi:signal transduction histidine kinase